MATLRPVIAALMLISACSHRSPSAGAGTPVPPQLVGAPTLIPNPNPAVPLAAVLSVTTDVPTRVELRIADGSREWSVDADRDLRTAHERVPVLGLRPGREHRITVTVRGADGAATTLADPLGFTTPALPSGFPSLEVTASRPELMEPGVTIFTINSPAFGDTTVMLDAEGQVVWYFNDPRLVQPVYQSHIAFPLADGSLVLLVDSRSLLEIDMLGEVRRGWSATRAKPVLAGSVPVATDSFHHDLISMPLGDDADFAVLSTETRQYLSYPSSVINTYETDPQAEVVGDTIVEFRRDGTIVREIKLLDLLDPYRLCYDGLAPFWNGYYERSTRDWSHGNGIAYDPADGSYVVSLRHQDVVLKLDRKSGAIRWLLGDPARWLPPYDQLLLSRAEPATDWQYHQHAPQLQADGRILLFDNGNQRAVPPTPPLEPEEVYSRAVEYEIDEHARVVRQTWAYGSRPPGTSAAPWFYTGFAGCARQMPKTRNVLVCDGAKQRGAIDPQIYARIVEVARAPETGIVFEVTVRDPSQEARSYWVYRAERLSGVYR